MVKTKTLPIALIIAMFFTCFAFVATVNAASKPSAVKWAESIANNNAYTYGLVTTCPKCKEKAKKKYSCAGFVIAAYAHGTKDAEALSWCRNGQNRTVTNLSKAMKKSKHWVNKGKLAKSKLQPGDVLFYNTQHTEIYDGNGKMVGAHGMNNGAKESISIAKLKSGYTMVYRYKK